MKNSNAEGIPLWGALHESIQWVLYLPAVFGLTLIFGFLFNLLSTIRGDFQGIFLYLQTPLNAGLCATVFVWLGLNLAPRAPKTCAWTIYSILAFFCLLAVVRFIAVAFFIDSESIKQSDVIELLKSLGWLSAGIFFLLRWGRESTQVKEATRQ